MFKTIRAADDKNTEVAAAIPLSLKGVLHIYPEF
jgi:hypothetical protein